MSYLLLAHGGEAVIIDATINVPVLVERAVALGASVVTLLDTHAHADHVSGGLVARGGHVRYATPDHEAAHRLGGVPVHAGTTLVQLPGNLMVTAAPGHTPESVVYELGNLLFTGDTLFLDGVGRPDLGSDTRVEAGTLWGTLQDIVRRFPAGRVVLPAHVRDVRAIRPGVPIAATLGELRGELPPLALDRDAFVAWAAQSLPSPPANFARIKEMNRALAPLGSEEELRDLEAGPNRCAV